ncbi:MAG: hypothetical protein IKA99_03600, partial [Clostridia bacterium]|nr:hypothetical protein [Clostridia bacterium]
MKHLLGFDVGTTSIKGCVFDEQGKEIATVGKAYDLITDGNFVEFPAEKFFEIFSECYDVLRSKTHIDALAIDTQGETLIFLDKDGKPLMNAIIWLDNRADQEAKEIEAQFGLRKIYEVTGQTEVPAGYPAPKILWLKRNRPEIFEKTSKILLLEDYLLYRLTGEFVSDKSLCSSTLYFDARCGSYWKEMLDYLGVDESMFPTLKDSGQFIAEVDGVKISAGALDQVSGFLGAGIKEGKMSEMTGTSLAVCAYSKVIPPYFEGIKVPAYYVDKDKYCLLMWAPTAGMTLEWYKKNFCEGWDYSRINEEASKVPVGSEGLVVSPNMCGSVMPTNDAGLKGGVYGIDIKHTRAHFIRAIMESVASLIRTYVDYLNIPTEEIVSIGGGARSKLWLQIKADITNKTLITLENKEVGCLGSA